MANNTKKNWESGIYIDAIDLAKKIDKLNEMHVNYSIKIVDGIASGERVVRLDWDQGYINDRIEMSYKKIEDAQKKLELLEGI